MPVYADMAGGGLRRPTLRSFLSYRQTAGASELKLSDFVGTFIAHMLAKNIFRVRSPEQITWPDLCESVRSCQSQSIRPISFKLSEVCNCWILLYFLSLPIPVPLQSLSAAPVNGSQLATNRIAGRPPPSAAPVNDPARGRSARSPGRRDRAEGGSLAALAVSRSEACVTEGWMLVHFGGRVAGSASALWHEPA